MVLATQIDTAEEHRAALTRIHELMGSEAGTPESEELRHLGEIVCDYELRTMEFLQGPTDGVDALEFELDQLHTTLEAVLPIFGSEDAFAAYMLREQDVSAPQAQQLADLLDLPLDDFTCPFREDAEPGEVMIGGTPWRERLEAMVERRAAAA